MQRDWRCKGRGQDREYSLGLWFWVRRTLLPRFQSRGSLRALRQGALAGLRSRRLFPAAARRQIVLYFRDGLRASEVHVRCFPAHVIEQARLIPFFGQWGKLDAGTVGSQPPDEPVAVEAYAGIVDADGGVHQSRAGEFFGGGVRVPGPGGSADSLGFARDEGAFAGGHSQA